MFMFPNFSSDIKVIEFNMETFNWSQSKMRCRNIDNIYLEDKFASFNVHNKKRRHQDNF